MNFQFSARDTLGHLHEGSIEAVSSEDATQRLRRDGLQVVSLEDGDDGLNLFPRRIRRGDIIYTTTQLAIMVDTGINLAAALEGIIEQEENPSLRRLLSSLKQDVESGESFSSALAKYPKHFDKTFIALVKASEETGTLGQMLEHISAYLRKELDNRSKVRSAMTYPAIMAIVATGVTIFLLTFIMPKFTPLFSRRGIELPMSTVFLMHVSTAMINYWWAWLLGIATAIGGFIFVGRTTAGRCFFDWVKINLPVVGSSYRKVCISRSVHTLGTLIDADVPVLQALELSSEVAGNYHYEKVWHHVVDEVTNGNRIADGLQGNPLFPRTLVQMMDSGEETGKLGYVLKKVSGYYDGEVETSLKTATSMLEPVMIAVMGLVVGGIGMSLMLPIFSLSRGG